MAKQVINTGNTANDGTGDTLRGASIKINANFTEVYNSSESAFSKANSSYTLANAAFAYANSSMSLITQELVANVDFIAAINSSQNTNITSVNTLANSAFDKANNSGTYANGAFTLANNTSNTTASAYNTANVSFDKANVAYTIANNALNVQTGGTLAGNLNLADNELSFNNGTVSHFSDSLYVTPSQNKSLVINTSELDGFNVNEYEWTFNANGVLSFPDGSQQSVGFEGFGVDEGARDSAVAAFTKANTANTLAQSAYNHANTANTLAQAGFDYGNTVNTLTLSVYNKANTANALAQAAYDFANTIVSDTQIDPVARLTANSGFDQANTANTLASDAYTLASDVGLDVAYLFEVNTSQNTNISLVANYANGAYTMSNTANVLAQAAFNKANTTPTGVANSSYSLELNAAGTLDLDYNNDTLLRFNASGITSYGQYTVEAANNISGNNSAILFDSNGSGIVFRLEDNTPASKNWGFYQTNVLFPDGTRQYTAVSDTLVQSSFNQANTANTLAQASFDYANTVNTLTQSSFNQANTANTLAQASFDTANNKLQFVTIPSTSKGTTGDLTNDIAANATYLYYCTTDYTDGVADIWKRIEWSADTW